ncbi:MAG: hypothetical protein HYY00_04100 [Chloroflexi bacterium]|nr:hypothetical protein [Chloroflexota bacterium]
MSYNIFVTDLTEEIGSLMLALLKIKAEQGAIFPEEQELLERLKAGPGHPPAPARKTSPAPHPQGDGRAS